MSEEKVEIRDPSEPKPETKNDRGLRVIKVHRIAGKRNSGKSVIGISTIFKLLRENPWLGEIWTPVDIWDGDPLTGEAIVGKLFDNTDGHWPDLARAKVIQVTSWQMLFRAFMKGKIQKAILFLDEVDRIISSREWKSEVNKFMNEVVMNASRYTDFVIMTLQRRDSVDINVRQTIDIDVRPTYGPDGRYPETRDSDEWRDKPVSYVWWEPTPDEAMRLENHEALPQDEEDDSKRKDISLRQTELSEFPWTWKRMFTYYHRDLPPTYRADQSLTDEEVMDMIERKEKPEEGLYYWMFNNSSVFHLNFCADVESHVPKFLPHDPIFLGRGVAHEKDFQKEVSNWCRDESWSISRENKEKLSYEIERIYARIRSEALVEAEKWERANKSERAQESNRSRQKKHREKSPAKMTQAEVAQEMLRESREDDLADTVVSDE